LQSTRGTPSWITQTYKLIGQLRQQLRIVLSATAGNKAEVTAIASTALMLADSALDRASSPNGPEGNHRLKEVLQHIRRNANRLASLTDRSDLSDASALRPELTDTLRAVDQLLDELKSIRDFSILLA
jgi:light-regulated signal transduction histidine kinase (bacteriophytochrome)